MTQVTKVNYMLESKLPGEKRISTNRLDFGDDATIGHCLRKCNIYEYKDGDFGRYLGKHKSGEFVVYCMNMDYSFHSYLTYGSLEELKGTWELD